MGDKTELTKNEFIDKATQELGGGFFAKLDATILWELYENWRKSPVNSARPLYVAAHEAIENAIVRGKHIRWCKSQED